MKYVIFVFLLLFVGCHKKEIIKPKGPHSHPRVPKRPKRQAAAIINTIHINYDDPNLLNDGREPGGMHDDIYGKKRVWDPHWVVVPVEENN